MKKTTIAIASAMLSAVLLAGCNAGGERTSTVLTPPSYSETSIPSVTENVSDESENTTSETATTSETTESQSAPSSASSSSGSQSEAPKPETTKAETTKSETTKAKTTKSESKASEAPETESEDDGYVSIGWLAAPKGYKPGSSASGSKPAETSAVKAESKPAETKPVETSAPEAEIKATNSIEAIKSVCGLVSEVEKSVDACIVDTYGANPYDVGYDYGKAYEAYVAACDWSLVFDADYYISSFPLLAMQYHYDKDLLLRHFQTVGIHEGRQGSKSFSVAAYMRNCGSDVKKSFGDNYEGYCFYYMLNHKSEKAIDASAKSGDKIQQKTVMTALQAEELKGVNMYRKEAGVADIAFDGELAAWANYRAYLNSHDGYKVHDWFRANDAVTDAVMDMYDARSLGENTVTVSCTKSKCSDHDCNYGDVEYDTYRTSKPHYEAMISAKNDLIGCSNCYKAPYVVSQFDCFINL